MSEVAVRIGKTPVYRNKQTGLLMVKSPSGGLRQAVGTSLMLASYIVEMEESDE